VIDDLDHRAKLRQLIRDHGHAWAIDLRPSETTCWEAVSRPTPSRTLVHCAHNLDELRAKIEGDAP
jgi:hypothetical protein